jgi:hypothetical protein
MAGTKGEPWSVRGGADCGDGAPYEGGRISGVMQNTGGGSMSPSKGEAEGKKGYGEGGGKRGETRHRDSMEGDRARPGDKKEMGREHKTSEGRGGKGGKGDAGFAKGDPWDRPASRLMGAFGHERHASKGKTVY